MKKIKLLDLFAGCGGLSEGFHQTGHYHSIAHVEWDKSCCLTLKKRLIDHWDYTEKNCNVLHFDIQRSEELITGWNDDKQYGSHLGLEKLIRKQNGVDVVIGGPPCQAYSIAGRVRDEHGMHYDYRNYLFESFIKIVHSFQPKVVVFENVPGILSAKPLGINIIEQITKEFDSAGYEIHSNLRENALIDMVSFKVPQNRKRLIIIALNKQYFHTDRQHILDKFYKIILINHTTEKLFTVKNALNNMPKFLPSDEDYRVGGKKFSHIPSFSKLHNHIPRYHNRRDIGIFYELAKDIQSGENKLTSIQAIKELYTKRTGKISNVHKYYVLRLDEPSNTIPAHLYKDGLRHIHPDPEQARTITVREAARLQTFDDNYEFIGNMGDQYKMIGNAVPPLFSQSIAKSIKYILKEFL